MTKETAAIKESTAWKIVAAEVDKTRPELYFLCNILNGVYYDRFPRTNELLWELRQRMIRRIDATLPDFEESAYHTSIISTNEAQSARVTACCLFAAIAEDEEASP